VKQAVLVLTVNFLLFAGPVFAESTGAADTEKHEGAKRNKVFPTFCYGAAASWLVRIIEQPERSNFVFRDFMAGLYFTTELQNVPYITPEIRLTAYYPAVSSFNYMPQPAKIPLHYGIDLFAGARFEFGWSFFKLNAGLGLHMLFLNSDRWNYLNLGAAGVIGVEFALTPKWSLLINGFASFDNGNLGANRDMEPFDFAYQYQTSIGVRYSKKKNNEVALSTLKKDKPPVVFDR